MDYAYLHLILNHFPIIGLAVVVVMLFYSLWKKNNQMLNFSLISLIVLALLSIPLEESGEAAEEIVENTMTTDEAFIHEHEEAAEYATPLMYLTGGVAFVAFFFNRRRSMIPVWLKSILIFLLLMTQVAMIRTGYLGGKIRRPELQNTTPASNDAAAEGEEERE